MPPRINIPPLTRALLVGLVSLSLLTAAIRYRQWASLHDPQKAPPADGEQLITVPYLTIVPASSLIYPWVFLLATLVEQNIFTLLITAVTIFYGGRYLERAWGSSEFTKFLLVVSLLPNLLSFSIYVLWYAATGNEVRSSTTICGGVALQAGFLVSFKQLVPEHTVTIAKGLVKMRVKNFPAIFLLSNILSGFIFGTDTASILAILGFVSSWTYLRFYKPSFADLSASQPASLRGDASETFAFAYFFPDPIHGPIAAAADVVYSVLLSLKICTPFTAADVDAGNSQAASRGEGGLPSLLGRSSGGGSSAPGSARAEAERRRALALKALDQRLHAATSHPAAPSPALTPAPTPSHPISNGGTPTGENEKGKEEAQSVG